MVTEQFQRTSLTDLSTDELNQRIEGKSNAPNPLASEELTRAMRLINNSGDEKLIGGFRKLAKTLLTGDYTSSGGNGFTYRNNAGIAIQSMLHNGDDQGVFERLIDETEYDPALQSQIETLQARLEVYCTKNNIAPKADHAQRNEI